MERILRGCGLRGKNREKGSYYSKQEQFTKVITKIMSHMGREYIDFLMEVFIMGSGIKTKEAGTENIRTCRNTHFTREILKTELITEKECSQIAQVRKQKESGRREN